MNPPFTPTQQKILDVLSDGLAHLREELHACLPDELGPLKNVQNHITAIRRRLRPKGQDIVCVISNRGIRYMHVRLLVPLSKDE